MIKLGGKTALEMDDIWHLAPGDGATENSDKFWQLWTEEIERAAAKTKRGGPPTEPWLGRPIIRFCWKKLLSAALMRLSADLLQFANPLLMQQILLIVEGSPAIVEEKDAWVLAVAMAACSYTAMLLSTHCKRTRQSLMWRPLFEMCRRGSCFQTITFRTASPSGCAAPSSGRCIAKPSISRPVPRPRIPLAGLSTVSLQPPAVRSRQFVLRPFAMSAPLLLQLMGCARSDVERRTEGESPQHRCRHCKQRLFYRPAQSSGLIVSWLCSTRRNFWSARLTTR